MLTNFAGFVKKTTNMDIKFYGLAFLSFLLFALNANGQAITVKTTPAVLKTDFALSDGKSATQIIIDDEDYAAVKLAANFFANDIKTVTGQSTIIKNTLESASVAVIAGTLGKSKIIDRLVATGKIQQVDKIKGHWEASLWQVIDNPTPGVAKALIIIGSDRRGTVYGIMSLSKIIGVSPWHWWADVTAAKKEKLTISVPQANWDEPGVKYRGIFINDEDWGLNQWARKTFEKELGSIGPKTYEKIFELMMRLKLNYLWPAMHGVTKEFGSIPEDWQMADRFGIVAGSSHCEPMLYNNIHWNEKTRGNWNYSLNRDTIYNVWQKTVLERKDAEAVWTVGIRGIHDRGMEAPPLAIPERIKVVEHVFKDQRGLINQNVTKQWGNVAQCFVPYKEVLPIYDAGLKVPDDVTLMWVDDNFGYIRRLSNPDERKRSGGSGLYWHLSYYGFPHSYTWINTTAPALMWEEFHKAWENQTRTMWVINVGDIKPMEIGIDYFSTLAWHPESERLNSQPDFLSSFLSAQFAPELVAPLTGLLNEYYRLGTVRKPEMMNRNWAISLSDKSSTGLQKQYTDLAKLETNLAARVPKGMQDAYTELIGFPLRVLTSSGLIFLHDRAIVYGADTSAHIAEINKLKNYLEAEVTHYNNDIAGGKWKFMMPGLYTGKTLSAWNSQVAWPWGETKQPDTSKKMIQPDVVRLASSADRQTVKGSAKWTLTAGLGNSGTAMALLPASLDATWKPADNSAPTLEYNFEANGKEGKVLIEFMPTFRTYPGMQLRVATGVDGKLIATVEVPGSNGREDENGPNRNQGVRNNYVQATVDLPAFRAGSHKFFIRAVDPGVVIDKVSFVGGVKAQQDNIQKN